MTKIIELKGEVGWEITAKGLQNRLPKDDQKVLLKIDSFGGSVFEGNRLFNTIKDHLAKFPESINVELGAVAASAASYFPLAVDPKNISVRDNTVFMIHKAWTIALGNSDEMQLQANILDGFDRMLAKIYSKVTNKSIDDTLDDMKNEVWLMGGQSIIDSGFATNIIESDGAENTEEIETLEKNEVSAKIEEIKNKLKEVDKNEDLKKWAAMIQPENKIESKPLESDGNIEEEDTVNMKLDEYLNSNPEAKAEQETLIKNAVASELKNERERGIEILNLAGLDLPDSIKNAFNDGLSVGDFAKNELKTRNEVLANAEPQKLGEFENKDQLPTKPEIENEAPDVWDKVMKEKYGDKEGAK